MTNELQNDELAKLVTDNPKVIVQYGASWCGLCKVVRPKFDQLANEVGEVKFVYVDAEKFPESRKLAEVNNLPTFAGFSDGKLVKQGMGSNETVIKGIIDAITAN